MSVIIALIPAIVVGVPMTIMDGLARTVGLKLIDYQKVEENNAKRMGELLQKEKLTPLEKKQLKLLQLGGNKPQYITSAPQEIKSDTTLVIPTRIRNIEYLLRTLEELGTQNVIVKEESVIANFTKLSVCYQPDKEGYIQLRFIGKIKEEEAYNFKNLLETQYGKQLQEAVYKQVKERAQNQGLKLEQEYVEEDNTIVLTYNV